MAHDDELEAQVDRWRGYVHSRQVISTADVDELEDHLRGQVADLRATGLDDDEAFLVAIKRLGNLDAVSREYAREHSDRLWKQLALVPDDAADSKVPRWRELAVVLGLAFGAGVAVRAGISWFGDDEVGLVRNVGLLVLPFLAAYLGWKRKAGPRTVAAVVVPFVVLAVVLNVYPFHPEGSTELLAILHAPVVMWLVVGLAYVAGSWRSDGRRMDFVRFTGELAIYYTLLALGGGVLLGLTAGMLQIVGLDPGPGIAGWVMPFAVPGALVVAAWLVEAKQDVVENIAPVLTRIFTPLTIAMLLAVLVVLIASGGIVEVDRDLLIVMDAILVLVLALLVYSISARDPFAPPGLADWLQLVMVGAALAVDAVMLTAMLTRIAQFGTSPNKIAALGLNLLLLVHLGASAWRSARFLRGRGTFAQLERWQTRYLPVYGAWAAVVVLVFPPLFDFV
ncbi:permease prefix domain 1-containing protein [Cellulomonas sp. URHE0023]|uniref:permease prefix domain 1-containing protein n=1 Tax=Cellulomonas sp. URHE0023 TaxID=1380354 RepID=UPI000552B8A7|nr:permease prefix domain 1-containing protein [Cellulomonas sp. URHE0023]